MNTSWEPLSGDYSSRLIFLSSLLHRPSQGHTLAGFCRKEIIKGYHFGWGDTRAVSPVSNTSAPVLPEGRSTIPRAPLVCCLESSRCPMNAADRKVEREKAAHTCVILEQLCCWLHEDTKAFSTKSTHVAGWDRRGEEALKEDGAP